MGQSITSLPNSRYTAIDEDELRGIREEIARMADTLARLDVRPAQPMAPSQRRPPETGSGTSSTEIRNLIRARRSRDKFIVGRLFEDPAWDMLLDLYAARLEQSEVSVSSLCHASGVAPTTALRWIARLSDAGLIDRSNDPFDRRRCFIELSEHAVEVMNLYFASNKNAGLPLC